MASGKIERIRAKVRKRQYDMSAHAMEEMAEDDLDICDVETAVLNGRITRSTRDDPRGTTYVIEGKATDRLTPVGIVGRFTSRERYLIITVYVIT